MAPMRFGPVAFDASRRWRERLAPGRGPQAAVLADIGPVEALRPQAVPDEAGLVGDPLLVHRLVDARQDAHHLAAARIDADGRAERVHHVDGLGLGQLPRAAP